MNNVWRPSCQQSVKETVSPFMVSKIADGAICPTLIILILVTVLDLCYLHSIYKPTCVRPEALPAKELTLAFNQIR